MTIKQLKSIISDLPDDMLVLTHHWDGAPRGEPWIAYLQPGQFVIGELECYEKIENFHVPLNEKPK